MSMDEWDPVQELVQLRKRFSELFERSLAQGSLEEPTPQGYWSPPVDVFLDDDCVHVNVDLPGIAKEDVDIQLSGHQLTIRGVRRSKGTDGKAFYHRVERQYGPYERVLQLNQSIDVDRISAQYELGVLTVKLPVRQGPIQKKIELSEDN